MLNNYLKEFEGNIVIIYGEETEEGKLYFPQWQKNRQQYLYKGEVRQENLREILPNEVVIEFDHKNEYYVQSQEFKSLKNEAIQYIEKIKNLLIEQNINFHVTDHNGKSPHIRFKIKQLETCEHEIRGEYKKRMCDDILKKILFNSQGLSIDYSLLLSKNKLIGIENQPHWKKVYKGYKEEITFIKEDGRDLQTNIQDIISLTKELESCKKKDNELNKELIQPGDIRIEKLTDLFKKYYIQGNRNYFILAYAGMCVRKKIQKEDTQKICFDILKEIGYENDINESLRRINSTYDIDSHVAVTIHLKKLTNYSEDTYKDLRECFKKRFGANLSLELLKTALNEFDLVKKLYEVQPFYYDENKLFWFWDDTEKLWKMVDEVDIFVFMDPDHKDNESLNAKKKAKIIEALKRYGRNKKPKEIKDTWVQFKNKAIDFETGREFNPSPEYNFRNPIPWKVGESTECPNMERIFKEWVGEKWTSSLFEIIAYCTLPSYPIHRIFCFTGGGMNGKSKYLDVITKFVGEKNCCSSELDSITENRFETANLYNKLVCLMGETNFTALKKTQMLKKLSDGSPVKFEFKNVTGFTGRSYAKIVIATNSLPTTHDKTLGFFRRWMNIDFPNTFNEKKDILKEIPEVEYENLSARSIILLKRLIKDREFTNEGTPSDRKQRYEDRSDPLQKFIKENCILEIDVFIYKYQFSDLYKKWLTENGYRLVSDREINLQMGERFGDARKGENQYWVWLGVKIDDRHDRCDSGLFSTAFSHREPDTKKTTITTELTINHIDNNDKPLKLMDFDGINDTEKLDPIIFSPSDLLKFIEFEDKGDGVSLDFLEKNVAENALGSFEFWIENLKSKGDIFFIKGDRVKILQ